MKRITFMGQVKNIEFASRWREKLTSLDVEQGRKLSTLIKQSYSLSDEAPVAGGKIPSPRGREQNLLRERVYKEKAKAAQKRQSLKIDKTSPKKEYASDRRFRLEKLRENKANKLIDKTVDDFNKAVKAPSPSQAFNPKMEFDFTGLGNESKPKWDKTKLKKAGLGAAGLLTAGAIGYGVYRKMRSDKGKKRGNYRK